LTPFAEIIKMAKPLVAIIGRPNVGKSTLFNKIIGKRLSIVEDTPGVTRDRLYSDAEWCGRRFTVIDTGGLSMDESDSMLKHIRRQAETAIETCDCIIFVLDVRTGISSEDYEIAALLRKSGKKIIVAVNKVDNYKNYDVYEFYNLGLGDVFAVSAASGDGVAELLDELIKDFGDIKDADDNSYVNVAVLGRPNAGKSSLVNKLLGYERTIVTDIAGTTRDAIDTLIKVGDREYNIIDTAGIRRKRSVNENVEYYSIVRALASIKRADVCLLVIDSEEGISEQDVRICGYIHEEGKPSIIVMNKWDKIGKDTSTVNKFEAELKEKLKFMDYFKSIYVSALTGRRTDKIFELVDYVYEKSCFKVSTGVLNDVITDAVSVSEPPSFKGKKLNILYAAQVDIKPPTFKLFVNDSKLLHFSYKRYLENSLRAAFSLDATPIRLIIKNRDKDS
jgi:GTP-binding protein